jgi:hypothetical protein
MAQPIQRARQALRQAAAAQNGEQQAGSFRSVRSDLTEAEMEEGLARQRSRHAHAPHLLLVAIHPIANASSVLSSRSHDSCPHLGLP